MRPDVAALAVIVFAGCTAPAPSQGAFLPEPQADPSRMTPARALHERLLVLDSHLDTPAWFHTPDYDFSARGDVETDGTQVDLPRMKEGGLDGGFWVIYIPQGPLDAASYAAARNAALLRQMSIREIAARHKADLGLAFTVNDAARLTAEGRRLVYQSMENAYPLGEDLSLLETFYIGGLRMIAPVHFKNNQFADSATDVTALHGGLSPLGEQLVREANRLGLILDGSHASDEAVRDMLAISTTPLILSHSGPKGVFDHPRNLPDDLLKEIAADGGVIQVNAFGAYLEPLAQSPERLAALEAFAKEWGNDPSTLDATMRMRRQEALRALNRTYPPARSSFEKFLEHLFYMLDLVGPDHVGIGADWDGGGGVDGMKDITEIPKITQALIARGYSEDEIAKIWGGNMLRLLAAAEAARTSAIVSADVVK